MAVYSFRASCVSSRDKLHCSMKVCSCCIRQTGKRLKNLLVTFFFAERNPVRIANTCRPTALSRSVTYA